jgi:hypothetical protein
MIERHRVGDSTVESTIIEDSLYEALGLMSSKSDHYPIPQVKASHLGVTDFWGFDDHLGYVLNLNEVPRTWAVSRVPLGSADERIFHVRVPLLFWS